MSVFHLIHCITRKMDKGMLGRKIQKGIFHCYKTRLFLRIASLSCLFCGLGSKNVLKIFGQYQVYSNGFNTIHSSSSSHALRVTLPCRSLQITEQVYGPEHWQTGCATCSVARVKTAKGNSMCSLSLATFKVIMAVNVAVLCTNYSYDCNAQMLDNLLLDS